MFRNTITGDVANEMPKMYRASNAGVCYKCDKSINNGELIQWAKAGPSKGKRYHINCEAPRVNPWMEIDGPAPAPEAPKPPLPNPAYEMEVPPEGETEPANDTPEESFDDIKGDGLTNMIAKIVQKQIIHNIDKKVEASLDVINRNVKAKLETLAVPSIIVKRHELPDVKLDFVHKQFNDVLQILAAGKYPYLHGSPGGHKSTLGPQLAQALGVRYGYMSLCEQTPEYVVKGFTSPIDGKYYESQFVDFYKNGGLYFWDEMDNANDNLRNALNTALENSYLATDQGLVHKSGTFYLVAAGNTCGKGAHPAFPSRTAFDAAFAVRWFFVEFQYDWNLAQHITVGINEHAGPYVEWCRKVSAWALANGIQLVMSPRESYTLATLAKTTTLSDSILLDGVLRGLDLPSKEKMLANFPFPSITRG